MKPIHQRAYEVPSSPEWLAFRDERARVNSEMHALGVQLRAATAARIPLVYAVLRTEEPLVKIGTSVRLPSRASWNGRLARFGSLGRHQYETVRLIAVTPGDHAVERQVHERLAAHRVRIDGLPGGGVTEHFHIHPDVVAWINETREAIDGLEPVTLAECLAYSAAQ